MRLTKELTEKEKKKMAVKAAFEEVKYVFLMLLLYFGIIGAVIFDVWLIVFIASLFSSLIIKIIVDVGLIILEAFILVFISAYRRNLK